MRAAGPWLLTKGVARMDATMTRTHVLTRGGRLGSGGGVGGFLRTRHPSPFAQVRATRSLAVTALYGSVAALTVVLASTACVDPQQKKIEPRPRAGDRRPATAPHRGPGRMKAIDAPPSYARYDVSMPRHERVGTSVKGRPIETVTFGNGHDCVFILATIHGDEDAGTPLVERLRDYLRSRPDLSRGRRIVLMPLANPDGMAEQTRGNSNGIDLNRNYPAGNFRASSRNGDAALSEPESRAIYDVIERCHPRRIVSIHQPLRSGVECIDHDGPAESLAEAMSLHADIPVRKLGSRPGSLGSYAGVTLGIPIITLELPREVKGWDGRRLWDAFGNMLLAAVTYPEPLTALAGE